MSGSMFDRAAPPSDRLGTAKLKGIKRDTHQFKELKIKGTPINSRSTGQMTTFLRFRSLTERIILFVALQMCLRP